MVSLTSLWIPILASAGFVFVTSSVIHMVLGYHASDYGMLPGEDDVQAALRKFNLPTGDFMLPCAQSPKHAASQEFREKLARGPVMSLTILPNGGTSMGRSLGLWFLFCVLVGLFSAYVAALTLPAGSHYRVVFRVVSTVAFGALARTCSAVSELLIDQTNDACVGQRHGLRAPGDAQRGQCDAAYAAT